MAPLKKKNSQCALVWLSE